MQGGVYMRQWLVELRNQQNISQQKTAELSGISQSYYASIEMGTRGKPLNANIAKKIAETLDFDWTIFYDEGIKA